MRDVILIPGLGTNNERLYIWLRPLWRLYGVRLHVCELAWEDGGDFEPKYQKLLAAAEGCRNLIGVVGASAGASATIILAARNPELTQRIVSICGVLDSNYLNPVTMQKRSPAFLTAAKIADQYLSEDENLAKKLLTIRPLSDNTVDPSVATVPGAADLRVRTRGHAFSIAYTLTFKIGFIKKFLLS
ncbi:MAG TPA: hypothetical protein VLE72_02385 [Candidatus Saccharimonadales bacterium]|nr:hypothetical protein [Candidatus Saccharimonadales bacterium]